MGIEIISLTGKGDALAHSVRQSNAPEWRAINYIKKMGGKTSKENLVSFAYNGDYATASSVVRNLKYKGIVTTE